MPAAVPTLGDSELSAAVERSGLRRVHVLGWRDLADDEAGGSELHLHEIARRWAAAGVEVTMRTSAAAGRSSHESRGGYEVTRRGGRMTVFPRVAARELARRPSYDALIEIWNGVPWGSPWWSRVPGVVWLHHVHGPMWDQTLGPVLGPVGRRLETRIAPRSYRRQRIVTLAESSRRELIEELGFAPDRVRVISPGIGERFTPGADRARVPTVLAVGRLVAVKRFELLLDAMVEVRREVPDARLVIVGEGYEREALVGRIAALGAQDWVRLAGQVDDDALLDLYRTSWLLASASLAEGWGMTITEAAACGTPAVVTDIVGHRDAVRHDVSGRLVGPAELGQELTWLLTDASARARLAEGARARAGELTWDRAALASFDVLAEEVARWHAR